MTEVVFTLLVGPVIDQALYKVASLLGRSLREFWYSGDLKAELETLQERLILVKPVLENVDQSDEGTIGWLQRIQDAADDLRVLEDEHAYGAHRQKGRIQSQFKKQVHHFLFRSRSMLSKIKEINMSFNRIVLESNCIKLINHSQNREADDSFDDFEVLGRDADVLKFESLLDELSQKHHLSGLSIVGMPGVGKTAVATSICVRARENHPSSLVAWVPVRKDLKEAMILGQMLQCLDSHAAGMTEIGQILGHLKPMLENKKILKILLILDGLWNEEHARGLKEFICRLPRWFATARISVVITTSNKEVASIMGTEPIPLHEHELQKLSDDDCWLIMEENVLRSSNRTSIQHHPQLLSIGKDIAKQCGGLPLVAAVFGKHLGAHIEVDNWSAIRDNKAWHAGHRKKILSQLKKSYDHLPLHLRRCFSFCSIFPKEKIVKISRDELVQCWMANGFLSKSNDSRSDEEEDVGNKYVNDLVSNYLLEVVDMDECGNIKFCKMHDEVHNLALLSAKHEILIWPDAQTVEKSVRHMRVESDENLRAIPKGVSERLRSLFLDVDVLHMMPKKPRSLQSFKLEAAAANELPSSLGRLKYYMKYLDISESGIKRLPKSVTKFYNLQTLRFTDCKSLERLPSGIENLVSLRHIYFDDERHVPSSIGKLASLRTLPLFVVGREKGRRIEELNSLNQLSGKLKICKLELASQSDATKAKLKDKGELIELQFVWSENRANNPEDMDVLEGLQPPSTLKSLTIENYRGGNCPSWMENLEQLVELKLIDCDECGNISCLERLPELKVLNIKAMHNVSRIGRMSYHQSSSQGEGESILPVLALRKLTLSKMTKLEGCETTQGMGWKTEQGMVVFSRLEELHVGDCPELKTWWEDGSAYPKLSMLGIQSCPNLQAIPIGLLNLTSLDINNCPKLMEYAQEGSDKWSSIRHAHRIRINGQIVRSRRSRFFKVPFLRQ
ncbi:hypothetical protein SLEP1_g20159 [Rubroshorea leprosula]|uniref:Uncharacterized protein n=1 Tax=Rubroshorea leprosula TaxID=152421 RepID=A0AAV5JC97_9ROSI|nr:hypothetical protein SLEP1_g20159 [Rubroshorea leprosula]